MNKEDSTVWLLSNNVGFFMFLMSVTHFSHIDPHSIASLLSFVVLNEAYSAQTAVYMTAVHRMYMF